MGDVFPHVHPDQGLDLALERMGANHLEILPVVSRADVHKLEGIVTLRDVLNFYGVSAPERTLQGRRAPCTSRCARESAADAQERGCGIRWGRSRRRGACG